MSQHYPKADDVLVPSDTPRWPSKSLKRIIEKDGLIVPILVNKAGGRATLKEGIVDVFMAADKYHGERVLACQELGFETLLVETEWTEEDL